MYKKECYICKNAEGKLWCKYCHNYYCKSCSTSSDNGALENCCNICSSTISELQCIECKNLLSYVIPMESDNGKSLVYWGMLKCSVSNKILNMVDAKSIVDCVHLDKKN